MEKGILFPQVNPELEDKECDYIKTSNKLEFSRYFFFYVTLNTVSSILFMNVDWRLVFMERARGT